MRIGRMTYADLDRMRRARWRELYEQAVDDGYGEDEAADMADEGAEGYASELECAADADADGIRDAMLHG